MTLWEMLPDSVRDEGEGEWRLALSLALGAKGELRHLLAALGGGRRVLQSLDAAQLGPPFPGKAWPALVRREVSLCKELGIRIVWPEEPSWPSHLDQAPRPPAFLLVQGQWPPPPGKPSIAMVGSRRASDYGKRQAHDLASCWSRSGGIVVSGGAVGIDAASHRACLEAGGYTVAVLGSGLKSPYPSSHRSLFDAIRKQGALVSEYPSVLPNAPYHFPERNRLLAALADAVVIVQCREGSGALHTAKFARLLKKPLLVVPGPVDDAACSGSNALLGQGAGLLAGVPGMEELHQQLAGQKGPRKPNGGEGIPQEPTGISLSLLDPPAQRVLSALAEGVCHMDDLSVALNASPASLSAALLECELQGWVSREAGNRYRLRVTVAR